MTWKQRLTRAGVAGGLAWASGSIAPSNLQAQQFQFLPSLTASQLYDSNLFMTSSNHQSDLITRVTPAVDAALRAPLLTLTGRYTIDLERFASHRELTTAAARQHGALTLEYRPTSRTAIAAAADAATTETPGELNVQSGFAIGRAHARQLTARAAVIRELGETTTGAVDYAFTDGRIAGGFEVDEHSAKIGAARHVTPRDTITAHYGLRLFRFASANSSLFQTSHAATVGWNRTVTQRAAISLSGGSRVTNGVPAPELSAGARYRLADGELSFDYARAQTTVLGLAGVAATQSIVAAARWRPTRSTQAIVAPGYYRTTLGGREANVYRTTLSLQRVISPNLALDVTVDGNLQFDNLYLPVAQRIPRHDVIVRLMAGPATTLGLVHAR